MNSRHVSHSCLGQSGGTCWCIPYKDGFLLPPADPAMPRSPRSPRPMNIGARGVLPFGEALRGHRAISQHSSHDLVEEVGQAQVPAGGERLVIHPLADGQVEYPHAEGRENDRTAPIH